MTRYIREVRDFNGALLSREESLQAFPKVTQGEDWYQPGFDRLVVRHVRDLQSTGPEATRQTIVTVGPPYVLPQSPRILPGAPRTLGFRGRAAN